MTAPSQTPVLTHDDARKATWFELFFDLVFVVAVAIPPFSTRYGQSQTSK